MLMNGRELIIQSTKIIINAFNPAMRKDITIHALQSKERSIVDNRLTYSNTTVHIH